MVNVSDWKSENPGSSPEPPTNKGQYDIYIKTSGANKFDSSLGDSKIIAG